MKVTLITLVKTLTFSLIPLFCSAQQTINGSITHNNQIRDYILYVPDIYSVETPVPLVFNFHGYTRSANHQMSYGDFRPIADTAGFIIVHPMGTRDALGNTHFNVGWGSSIANDVGFTEAMIDSISAQYNIDERRIYSTGMSNGGFMSYLLACQLGEKIAAIASVTGSMSPATFDACTPVHPIPILEIHGTADNVVEYNGSGIARSIADVLAYWQEYNNTRMIPSITALPDINEADGSTVEHIVYSDGDNGVNIEHFKINGGGHTWPGTANGNSETNYDIDASAEIWKFFSQYDIDGRIGITATEHLEKNLEINIFPNPTNGEINIQLNSENKLYYQVLSLMGKTTNSGIISGSDIRIDLSQAPAGVYILKIAGKNYKIVKSD